MKKLASLFKEKKPLKMLDVGTGGGNFISLIQNVYTTYEEIIGIDTLNVAINTATDNFKDDNRISFVEMDGTHLEFADETFDVVSLSNSLHHIRNPKSIIAEMTRVLKKGGFLIFGEMMSNHLDERQLSHLKMHHFAAKIDRLRGVTHDETLSDKEIISLLEEASPLKITNHWHLFYERQKENSDDEINWLLSTIDKLTNNVPKNMETELKLEAESIKSYIRIHGFDSCTTMIVVMDK